MRMGTYYRNELLKNLNIKTEKRDIVLDVGCYDAYWLSLQKAKEKHAIDMEISPIHKNIDYKKGDATKLPYKNNYFDKVFAFEVLEHIEFGKEKRVLSELIRVTKSKGEIILSTPSKYIRLFPSFLTNLVSRKWGHYKQNGYTKEEILGFIPKRVKSIQIKELDARQYLKFYLPMRALWTVYDGLAKKILSLFAKKDATSEGNKGYLIIRIIK